MVEKRDFVVTSFQVSFELDLGDRSSMVGSWANDNLGYFVSRHWPLIRFLKREGPYIYIPIYPMVLGGERH
jgi:hypothetical protein